MQKFIVVGVERSKGSFTARDGSGQEVAYDNMILHCLAVNESPKAKLKMICGFSEFKSFKMKNDFENFVFVDDLPVQTFADLYKCEIEVYLDNDKVDCIKVVSIDGKI